MQKNQQNKDSDHHTHEQDELAKLRQLNSSRSVIQVEHTLQNLQKKDDKKQETHEEGSERSQTGHQHDHNCKHDHKKDTKSKHGSKHRKGNKNYGIIFYCVFTCLSCLYLEVYCFHPLQQDEDKRKIKSFFTSLIVFMALWSYYQTITTKNDLKKLAGAPNIVVNQNGLTDQNYLQKQCDHCKYYKMPRVSHCSTCGMCVMKLDHHCIWTQNCIGYRNQKPFYLFTLYMSIGLYQFWTATFAAFSKMYGDCKFFQFFEPGVYILWVITCFSAFFVGIMIVALLFSHTMMILTNHTTLMSMKFKRMCPLPFCQFRQMILQDEYINPYDRGEIQNLRNLFGTNIFTAFLPLTRQPENDFVFEKPNPEPTNGQITSFLGGAEAQSMREEQLRRTMLRVKQLYKGQVFKFNDKILQVK